ncbi:branched-chain amino acid ABC transporter permease [Ferviditalea candida]|uniref:Branched-chain amino acid ABC transporter permease n=1 Tax=Ferviditalea candida TaxID=3108399 RepID=A0ABU5ZD30_9BACL|nr:branched-chain amino acid ABC transporter permease [Paenibacillaceae bacterium T2]
MDKGIRWFPYFVLLAALCLIPLLFSSYVLGIASEILIFSIFALSLNVLVGYTGLVSLGHAAFFGVGAYASSLIALHFSDHLMITLAGGFIIAVIVSAVIGFFCTRVSGFYFLMLTLAFSQMIYGLVYRWGSLTGGDNGLSGIPKPRLLPSFRIDSGVSVYFLILIVFGVVLLGLNIVLRSPFGQILSGIRENEVRMKAMGYNTTLYKIYSFLIAGGLGGVAGSMYSYFNGFVSPKDVYWTLSGEVLIMVLVGGVATLIGPVLGAAFIVILKTVVGSYTDLWMLILGIVFILFVIFIPKGIAGIGSLRKKRAAGASVPLNAEN